jgi:hypothetical protein
MLQDSFFFSGPGGIRRWPFSCSRWLLDTQKKGKSVDRRKNHEKSAKKEAKRTPSESGAIMGTDINRVLHRCQRSIGRV